VNHKEIVLGIDLHDFQVPDRDAIAAHASGGTHPLDDARRKRRRADRTGRAVEHRSVSGRATPEVVALHDALEALAAADADHVDAVAVGEDTGDEHLVAGLQRIGPLRELHFAAHAGRRHAGLLVVATERLADTRRLLFHQPELHRFVAVGRGGLRLHDHARPGLDHGGRRHGAVLREDLGHAEFSTDDACHHLAILSESGSGIRGPGSDRIPHPASRIPVTCVPYRTP